MDVLRTQPDFFIQFPEERVIGRLAPTDTTLRKLPTPATAAPPQKELTTVPHENDTDVRPITLAIDEIF